MRNRSSTAAKVAAETSPQRLIRRSVETDRISSAFAKLRCCTPPSGGSKETCNGIPLSLVVNGRITINPAGPWLKMSVDTTSPGRTPACSWPLAGLRFINQISPRDGGDALILHLAHRLGWHPISDALLVPPATRLERTATSGRLRWSRARICCRR